MQSSRELSPLHKDKKHSIRFEKYAYVTVMSILALIFAAMFFSTARVYYAYNYDTNLPTIFKYDEFKVLNNEVCPGDLVELEMLIDKVKDYHGETSWYIVSENSSLFIKSGFPKSELGKDKIINPSVRVPIIASPGEYKARLKVIYQLNEFARASEPLVIFSEPFLVRSDCE